MNNKKSILAGLIGLALLAGCSQGPDQTDKHSGLALANMDTRVKPGDDFFRYVNGHWLGTAKIPDDRPSRSGIFTRAIWIRRPATPRALRRCCPC